MGIFGSRSRTAAPVGAPGSRRSAEGAGGLSIIGIGMRVRGDIETSGVVKVEGAVDGSIHAKQQVLVAKGGTVRGDIETREAVVGGEVRGGIQAQERVEIQDGAVVQGDVTTLRILVAEGGSINGQVRMGEPPPHGELRGQRPEAQRPIAAGRPSVPGAGVAVPPRAPAPGGVSPISRE